MAGVPRLAAKGAQLVPAPAADQAPVGSYSGGTAAYESLLSPRAGHLPAHVGVPLADIVNPRPPDARLRHLAAAAYLNIDGSQLYRYAEASPAEKE